MSYSKIIAIREEKLKLEQAEIEALKELAENAGAVEEEATEELTVELIEGASTVKELKELAEEYGIDLEGAKTKKAIQSVLLESVNTDDEEDEDEDEDEAEDTDELTTVEEVIDVYELNSLSADEINEYLESVELSTKGTKGAKVKRLAQAVLDGDLSFDTEDEDDEEGEETTPEDLEEMSLSELKDFAEEHGVEIPKTVKTKAKLVALLEEELFSEDDDEDDEDEDEDDEGQEVTADDLDDMSLSELKALADEYEVELPKTAKTKAKVATILKKELF